MAADNQRDNIGLVFHLRLVLLFWTLSQAAGKVYHISPLSADNCTHDQPPCLTLFDFAANSSQYLTSNTTLILTPNRHYLPMKLAVSNLATFAMTSESSSAQVVCESNAFIIFSSCQCVNISNIKFLGCGGNQVENVNDFLLQNARFEGEDRYGTALGLVETTGQDSSETALELIETMGQDSCGTALKLVKTTAQITGSAFLSNTKGTLTNIEVEVNIRGVPYIQLQ